MKVNLTSQLLLLTPASIYHLPLAKQQVDNFMASSANDKDSGSNSRTLRVAEASSNDVGRRISRVDPKVAEELGLSTGDAIEISSSVQQRKKTTALNWPAYQQDYGKGLIRIDGYTRNKLDVGINDNVDIRKVEAKDAQKITLA